MGSILKIGTTGGAVAPAAITETTTLNLDAGSPVPQGAARRLYPVIIVSAISGTWDVTLNKRLGGEVLKVAEKTTIPGTGLTVITLEATFLGTSVPNHAIPIPDQIVFTEQVAGSLTAEVWYVIA